MIELSKQHQKKQLYDFVTITNRNITLPAFLRQVSPSTVEILFNDLLPMSVNIGNRQKQLISALLQSVFLQHNKLKKDLQSQATTSKLQLLNNLISLPNFYINFISQPRLKQERIINISNVELHKRVMYMGVLEMAQNLEIQPRLLVINRLLVLGYHKLVAEYFLWNGMSEFVLQHAASFSKLKNLLAAFYQEYIMQLQPSKYQRDDLAKLLTNFANHSFDLTSAFVSLLNLDIKVHEKERYRTYFEIIHKTKLQVKIFENLLKWWAVSKTFILTEMHSRVRCNILYLLIYNWDKSELVNGDFMVSIIEGIKRKLTDGASKSQALLIWKALSQKMDLPKTAQVQNSWEFLIQSEKQHQQIQQNLVQKQGKSLEKMYECEINNTQILPSAKSFQQAQQATKQLQKDASNTKIQEYKSSSSQQEQTQQPQSIIIRPKNIYDCLLSLRHTNRQKIALQQLPFIIRHNNEDLILMWNSLLQQLLCPIKEQYRRILVMLLCKRPQEFVQSVSSHFMNRQTNVAQKIELIFIIVQGIEQLSSAQNMPEKEEENQDFYFKKVRSRYLKQPQSNLALQDKQKRIQEKSRRWGHTRIQHEKKQKQLNLNIIGSISRLNRFYPVANLIFYKIIDIFSLDIINSLRKHQIFVQHILKLLAIFTSNIKNHFEKQLLLTDICSYCQKIVQELIHGKEAKRYQQSGGQTLMLCLQVVNKVALVLDKHTSQHVMGSLKVIVQAARKLPNYGMNSVLDLIEANIYRNVYGLFQSDS